MHYGPDPCVVALTLGRPAVFVSTSGRVGLWSYGNDSGSVPRDQTVFASCRSGPPFITVFRPRCCTTKGLIASPQWIRFVRVIAGFRLGYKSEIAQAQLGQAARSYRVGASLKQRLRDAWFAAHRSHLSTLTLRRHVDSAPWPPGSGFAQQRSRPAPRRAWCSLCWALGCYGKARISRTDSPLWR